MRQQSNVVPASIENWSAELSSLLDELGHLLPSQGPLKDFIHHNPLHAFQALPFHEGVREASRIYGAAAYLPLDKYQSLYRQGQISRDALQKCLQDISTEKHVQHRLRAAMLEPSKEPGAQHPPVKEYSVQRWWRVSRGVELEAVNSHLFRFLSSFLDQGVSHWSMPHSDRSLWEAFIALPTWGAIARNKLVEELVMLSADEVILRCLNRLLDTKDIHRLYIRELLLSHPGWSGMIYTLEKNPECLSHSRQVSLRDLVAIELLLQLSHICDELGEDFIPFEGLAWKQARERALQEDARIREDSELYAQVWQEAWEWSYYSNILSGLQYRAENPKEKHPATWQAIFCIDDREESLRRHLEELEPRIETLSCPGFFGIDFLYHGPKDQRPVKLCPVPLKPKHLVRAISTTEPSKFRVLRPLSAISQGQGFWKPWTSFWQALRLAAMVLKPSLMKPEDQMEHAEAALGELQLLRGADAQSEEGYWLGYTHEEMADRVYNVLTAMGCLQKFAEFIAVIGHGASSVNNPYFSAYDCGACSGRPGAPNARAFVAMANMSSVRSLLASKGVVIPDSTLFVAGFHDTTRDEVIIFDRETLPESHQSLCKEFQSLLEKALRRNAKERCRRFGMFSPDATAENAFSHVQHRSQSIFEPRPELNHALNAICVVGRRDLSRGLFLDRRSFLHSYDPASDPRGKALAGILGAVIPVCGGINLEYYFSHMDSSVYGSGSKLPQNIVGLLGVSHGTDSDLLTGLPQQMTELHEPLRLLVVVEQEPEIVLEVLQANSALKEWTFHEWVRVACLSPRNYHLSILEKGIFKPFEGIRVPFLPEEVSSLALVAGKRHNLPVHSIQGGLS